MAKEIFGLISLETFPIEVKALHIRRGKLNLVNVGNTEISRTVTKCLYKRLVEYELNFSS